MRNVVVVTVALVATTATVPALLQVLQRRRLLDVPTARSSHAAPVPRGGGIAVLAGATLGVATAAGSVGWTVGVVVTASLAFGLLGFLDDLRSRSATVRLAAQVALAATGVAGLVWAAELPSWWTPVLALPAALWVIGYVNAFNFMDGVNGISGLHGVVGGLAAAALGARHDAADLQVLGLAVAAGSLGFLPWNAPRAKVFLGDVGSYGVGAWLALLALLAAVRADWPLAAFAPAAVYAADTVVTMARRARRGEPVMEAHREHVYQRLTDAGLSHLGAAGIAATASAATAVLGLAADATTSGVIRLGTVAAMAAVVLAYLGAPAWLGRRRSHLAHQAS